MVIDGVTGYLVPPADSDALAQAIIRLLKDGKRAKTMGKAGRDEVESKFSVEKMITRYEKLYHSLLEETYRA